MSFAFAWFYFQMCDRRLFRLDRLEVRIVPAGGAGVVVGVFGIDEESRCRHVPKLCSKSVAHGSVARRHL